MHTKSYFASTTFLLTICLALLACKGNDAGDEGNTGGGGADSAGSGGSSAGSSAGGMAGSAGASSGGTAGGTAGAGGAAATVVGTWAFVGGGDFGTQVVIDSVLIDNAGVMTAKSQLKSVDLPMVQVPSYVATDSAGKRLFVADENYSAFGQVLSYAIDSKTGKLSFLSARDANGAATVHVSVEKTGKWLLAPNFNSANVQVYPIAADGKIGAASDTKTVGKNPHAAYSDPTGKAVFVPCLSAQKVYQFTLDPTTGTLTASTPPTVDLAMGTGPRHMAFSTDGKLAYLIAENKLEITTYTINATMGTMSLVLGSETSTVAADVKAIVTAKTLSGRAAEIAVHPSGKFLYATTRVDMGNNAVEGYLASYPLDGAGKLGTPTFERVGKEPRGFGVSPDGKVLVVANQKSATDNLVSYTINEATGAVTLKSKLTIMNAPMMVSFAPATN